MINATKLSENERKEVIEYFVNFVDELHQMINDCSSDNEVDVMIDLLLSYRSIKFDNLGCKSKLPKILERYTDDNNMILTDNSNEKTDESSMYNEYNNSVISDANSVTSDDSCSTLSSYIFEEDEHDTINVKKMIAISFIDLNRARQLRPFLKLKKIYNKS